jgi:RNA polymerase sigma-70 factor (ECF subfamily)
MLGRVEEAEDLTVSVFEKALRAWDRRPPDTELRPWLFRIATNAAIDELRRRKLIQWRPWETFVGLFHPSQVAPDNPEREAIRGETVSLVRAALAELSPRDRAALVLREHQGLSVPEIAEALGISHGAAKVALFRARERLRDAYLKLGGEPYEPERAPGS